MSSSLWYPWKTDLEPPIPTLQSIPAETLSRNSNPPSPSIPSRSCAFSFPQVTTWSSSFLGSSSHLTLKSLVWAHNPFLWLSEPSCRYSNTHIPTSKFPCILKLFVKCYFSVLALSEAWLSLRTFLPLKWSFFSLIIVCLYMYVYINISHTVLRRSGLTG